jgi:hypothetical protein
MNVEPVRSQEAEPTKRSSVQKGGFKGRKVAKKEVLSKEVPRFERMLFLPIRTFTGKAYRAVGEHVFHETPVKVVSTLGYYGSAVVESLAEAVEKGAGYITKQEVGGVAIDLLAGAGSIATRASFEEAGVQQQATLDLLSKGVTFVGMPGVASAIKVGDAAGQANLTVASAHVWAFSKVFAKLFKYLGLPVMKYAIQIPASWVKHAASYFKKQYETLGKDSTWLQEHFIERGDKLLAQAYRVEQSTQAYFNMIASMVDQERFKKKDTKIQTPRTTPKLTGKEFLLLSQDEQKSIVYLAYKDTIRDKQQKLQSVAVTKWLDHVLTTYNALSQEDVSKFTPVQFEKLSKAEQLKLLELVHQDISRVYMNKRRDISAYRKAILHDEPFDMQNTSFKNKDDLLLFVARRFNQLPAKEQARMLDLSKDTIHALTYEEQTGLIELLIVKQQKKLSEELTPVQRTEVEHHLKRLEEMLHIKERNRKDAGIIEVTFRTSLTGKEKAIVRQLLNEKIEAVQVSKDSIHETTQALEQQLTERLSGIDQATDEDVLEAASMFQSLAYLKGVEQAAHEQFIQEERAEERLSKEVQALPKGKKVVKEEIDAQVGQKVKTPGMVQKPFLLGGNIVQKAFEHAFWGLSFVPRGAGWMATPQRVEYLVKGAANWIEYAQALASFTSLLSSGAGMVGFSAVSDRLNQASGAINWASNMTVDAILKTEEATIGVLKAISGFEKASWQNYIGPFFNLMGTSAELKGVAAQMKPLTQEFAKLKEQYQEGVVSAQDLGKQFDSVTDKIKEQFSGFIRDFIQKNPGAQVGKILGMDFQKICSIVAKKVPQDSPEFYNAVFFEMETTWASMIQEVTATIPTTGWIFRSPIVAGPEAGAFSVQGSEFLMKGLTDLHNKMQTIDQQIHAAEDAAKSLQALKESWAGWLAVASGGMDPNRVKSIESWHETLSQNFENAVWWAEKAQLVGIGNLRLAQGQMNCFANYAQQKETFQKAAGNIKWLASHGEGAERWLYSYLPLGQYIPTTAQIVSAGLSLYGATIDYASGMFAIKCITKLTAHSLRTTAPVIAKCVQPFWYSVASLTEETGKGLGKAAFHGFAFIGEKAQDVADEVYKVGYEAVKGEAYIDPKRIKQFLELSSDQKAHIRYVVLSSPKSSSIMNDLNAIVHRTKQSDNPETERRDFETHLASALLDPKDQERLAERILQVYDQLDLDEQNLFSPVLFLSLEPHERQRLIDIIREHGTITERDTIEDLIVQLNQQMSEERAQLETISVKEFETLTPKEQDDLRFRLIFSEAYKEKYLKHLRDQPDIAFVEQWKEYKSSSNIRNLLQLLPKLQEHEKAVLTPGDLHEMGEARMLQPYEILKDHAKLPFHELKDLEKRAKVHALNDREQALYTVLKELKVLEDVRNIHKLQGLREHALALSVALFNNCLRPAQKHKIYNVTRDEFDTLSVKEKKDVVDVLLKTSTLQAKEKLLLEDYRHSLDRSIKQDREAEGYILEAFAKLPAVSRAEFRRKQQLDKQVLQVAQDAAKECRNEAVREKRKLYAERNERIHRMKMGSYASLERVQHEEEMIRKLDAQIEEQEKIKKHFEQFLKQQGISLPPSEDIGRRATAIEAEKIKLKELDLSPELLKQGPDAVIDEVLKGMQASFEKESLATLKSQIDFFTAQQIRLPKNVPPLQKAVLRKQIDLLTAIRNKKLPKEPPPIQKQMRIEKSFDEPFTVPSKTGFFARLSNFFSGIWSAIFKRRKR